MQTNHYGKNQTGRHCARAFTLVELLLVLVILGTLASIVYPNMARHTVEARIKATRVQIASFDTALGVFEVENGYFPSGLNGLKDLVQRPRDAAEWHGPYIPKIPKDPWGHEYIYECPGNQNAATYDLMSMGPDGQPGTEDDITNWE
jgi:general secretion pathway protein G